MFKGEFALGLRGHFRSGRCLGCDSVSLSDIGLAPWGVTRREAVEASVEGGCIRGKSLGTRILNPPRFIFRMRLERSRRYKREKKDKKKKKKKKLTIRKAGDESKTGEKGRSVAGGEGGGARGRH